MASISLYSTTLPTPPWLCALWRTHDGHGAGDHASHVIYSVCTWFWNRTSRRSSAPSSSPSLPSNLQSSPLAEESLFQHVQFGRYERVERSHSCRDVMIKDTWGIDCYTRHSIEILLQLLGWESSLVTTFIRTVLAPTINQQTPTTAFDMRYELFLSWIV